MIIFAIHDVMYVILVTLIITFPIYDDIIFYVRNPCNALPPLAVITHHFSNSNTREKGILALV